MNMKVTISTVHTYHSRLTIHRCSSAVAHSHNHKSHIATHNLLIIYYHLSIYLKFRYRCTYCTEITK